MNTLWNQWSPLSKFILVMKELRCNEKEILKYKEKRLIRESYNQGMKVCASRACLKISIHSKMCEI